MLEFDSETATLLDLWSRAGTSGTTDPTASPSVIQYVPQTDSFLLYGHLETGYIFQVLGRANDTPIVVIQPPTSYSPVFDPGREVALSPQGDLLAVTDYDRSQGVERLWLVDVLTNQWRLAVARPVESLPNRVTWSPDQAWIAWWANTRASKADEVSAITFIDVAGQTVAREYTPPGIAVGNTDVFVGWTADAAGNSVLAVLQPGVGQGVTILDPSGSSETDHLLFDYSQLREMLPFLPEEGSEWVWQPVSR